MGWRLPHAARIRPVKLRAAWQDEVPNSLRQDASHESANAALSQGHDLIGTYLKIV
jgi:hypothetical protein